MPAGFTGLPDGNTHFHGTWAVEINYYMDPRLPAREPAIALPSAAAPASTGRKATAPTVASAVPASNKTRTEINSEPIRPDLRRQQADVGPKYTHFVDVWVAYRYWENKFGPRRQQSHQRRLLHRGGRQQQELHGKVVVFRRLGQVLTGAEVPNSAMISQRDRGFFGW